jgi:hypothetical protein
VRVLDRTPLLLLAVLHAPVRAVRQESRRKVIALCRYCCSSSGSWPARPSLFIGVAHILLLASLLVRDEQCRPLLFFSRPRAAGWCAGRLVRRHQLQGVGFTNSMASNMCSCVYASRLFYLIRVERCSQIR